MFLAEVDDKAAPADLFQAVKYPVILPSRIVRFRFELFAAEIFLNHRAERIRPKGYVVGLVCDDVLLPQFVVALRESGGPRFARQGPSLAPVAKIETDTSSPINEGVDVAQPQDRHLIRPQDIVEAVSTASITVFGEVVKCRLQGEPIPDAHSVDGFGLRKSSLADELKEFASSHSQIVRGCLGAQATRHIRIVCFSHWFVLFTPRGTQQIFMERYNAFARGLWHKYGSD